MNRLLDHDQDAKEFERILWQYYEQEKVRPSKNIYHLHTTEALVNRLINNFAKKDPGFIVSGEFDGDRLKGVAVGLTMGFVWGRPQTVFPQWYLNFVYNEKDWSPPKPRIHALVNPIVSLMESRGYYCHYKVTKFPKRINASNVDEYLRTQYNKLISDERYTPFVEVIIRDTSEIAGLNATYRAMLPSEVNTEQYNVVLMSHHLKSHLRTI